MNHFIQLKTKRLANSVFKFHLCIFVNEIYCYISALSECQNMSEIERNVKTL